MKYIPVYECDGEGEPMGIYYFAAQDLFGFTRFTFNFGGVGTRLDLAQGNTFKTVYVQEKIDKFIGRLRDAGVEVL